MVAGAFGFLAIIFWLVLIIGGIVGWVFFLVSAWRMMLAHEALAVAVQQLAKNSLTPNCSR